MSVHLRPEEIEAESFRIIEAEVGPHPWSLLEWPVVRRVIHTSADFDYARTLVFSAGAVPAGLEALRAGRPLVTDTTMALAGINKAGLARFGVATACFVADPEVARQARETGVTRSLLAMRRGAAENPGGIFIIGNAPTALFELVRLVREEGVRPALVVALPVGFVGAAESKEALVALEAECPGVAFITSRGRKGGSNVAAAVVNALLRLAEEGTV
ncbi:MAG TPA: precorrin-8X methylmutase [Geobacteraceae bacterium]